MVTIAPSRDYSTISNSSRIRDNAIYRGYVKRNDDAQRMGRISVWIPEICGDQTNETNWIIISYASPYAGATNPDDVSKQNTTAAGTQQSYGMWMQAPDLENQVLVCFVNGDVGQGYYFACIFQQNMNHMVPGIAAGTPTDTQSKADGVLPPVVEYNKQNTTSTQNPPRPSFAPLADGLMASGLSKDLQRGPASTSARREAPSKAFGLSTPRGSMFAIDDNEQNEFIRMRTRSGAQILIHETTGYIYISTKGGNAWIELSDNSIDVYSKNSVNIRAESDFNVRADGNIILDAGQAINLRAGTDITMQASKTIQAGAGTDIIMGALGGKLALSASTNLQFKAGQDLLTASTGQISLNAGGSLVTQSGSSTSMKAGGTFSRDAPTITDNGGGSTSAATVADSPPQGPKGTKAPDVQGGKSTTLDTIASRMPTHEPFKGHPKYDISGQDNTTTPNSAGQMAVTGDGQQVMLNSNMGMNCATGVGTKKMSTDVWNAIQTASSKNNIPFGNLAAFGDIESSFNPNAGSGLSSAKGLFQFTSGTWEDTVGKYGSANNVTKADIFDPGSNALMGASLYNQDVMAAQNAGISNPTAGQLYMMHNLGASGGLRFIQAAQSNPDAPLTSVLSAKEISNNPSLYANYSTVGAAYNALDGRVNGLASAYDAQAGLPAPCDRSGATAGMTASNTNASSTGTASSVANASGSASTAAPAGAATNTASSPVYGGTV